MLSVEQLVTSWLNFELARAWTTFVELQETQGIQELTNIKENAEGKMNLYWIWIKKYTEMVTGLAATMSTPKATSTDLRFGEW